MDTNSLFITQDEKKYNDINEEITYTNILDTIPFDSKEFPMEKTNWKELNKIEWRWRFLKFNDKTTVEISYINPNSTHRTHFNKKGEWVERDVPKIYDEYVDKTYYYYTDYLS
jgi:hypothetical protein